MSNDPKKPRTFIGRGGPMDGVKFRHYPDPTVTPAGKQWAFNDIELTFGTYVLEEKYARWEPKV